MKREDKRHLLNFEAYLKNEIYKHYLNVALNKQAVILDIQTNIKTLEFDMHEVIGKNWFETFLEESDRAAAIRDFYMTLKNTENNFFSYDIKSRHHKHEYMDFNYEIYKTNGEVFIILSGKLHYEI